MLSAIQRIMQEVNNAHDFDEALLIMVQRIREAIDTQSCSIFLFDKRSSEFVLLATKGLCAKQVGATRIDHHHGLIGEVAKRREVINLADMQTHSAYVHCAELGEETYHGYLAAPIIYQRRLLGVFVLQKQQIARFSEPELAFLITLTVQLAAEISHAESSGLIAQLDDKVEATEEAIYSGIASSTGVAIGRGVVIFPLADVDAVPERQVEDVEAEINSFHRALEEIREDIKRLSKRLATKLSPEDQALFDAYLYMLDDNGLGAEVDQEIRKGNWAQGALCKVIKAHVRQFESMEDEYLRDRGEDVRDLGQRILAQLQAKENQQPEYPDKVVLVGEEITASNLAEVPMGKLVGVVSGKGSSNSHVAILARALGVPAIMGVQDLVLPAVENKKIVIDGYYGHVYISPSDILLREFARLAEEEQQLNEELENLQGLPAETTDGHQVSMLVNTGMTADLGLSLSVGADGVGLYRSEVPFLSRKLFPSSEEQRVIYRQLLAAFAPRIVTMRTLDVGGDKHLPYFPIREDNPFLGWRGIRITLDHPELFLMQIRAMLKANIGFNNLRIMLPMISDVREVDEAVGLIQQAYSELQNEGKKVSMPKVGVMIEVPSAVYQTRLLAKRVDFISVGSNDLTQYLLAVDRNNSKVASLYDSLHPSVLNALAYIVKEAHSENVSVTICGEMAGDPAAALLLLGMGYDGLSMSAARIARVKWVIRQFSKKQTKQLVGEILVMDNAQAIRNRLERELESAGLGGLIRAGRY